MSVFTIKMKIRTWWIISKITEMKRRMFKFMFLVAVSLLGSLNASAYDFEVDGIYYNVLSAENLTCEVTNGDRMYQGDVVIPEKVTFMGRTMTVTGIGPMAFEDCVGLTSVKLPNSLTSIGESAFEDCVGLTSVKLPNSLTSIGESAFKDCYRLTSVEIPNSVTSIGEYAFYGCSGLTSVRFPTPSRV